MVQELEESLHGKTLEYTMELFEEAIAEGLEYMGVKIAFNGKTYSAPTVGLYGVKSKPENLLLVSSSKGSRETKENRKKNTKSLLLTRKVILGIHKNYNWYEE